ncbi:hypothetical protein BCR34DRAFT_345467 [Clohesyomyces aquaticus]|uniref:Uncharacterized protein n=1 Tax=Clohesyomyces aquaticus TaxID=1231657 RepID=A0A1Y1ZK84_9PLEO|nr:hypothetical protein BCR34DRAFT_345467 [Clohesyomyces aquaticus]
MATQIPTSPSPSLQPEGSTSPKERPSSHQSQSLNLSRPPTPTPPPSESDSVLTPKTEFMLDWAFKILGVASAILFGVWAPISYQATKSGNADNDEAQKELSRRMAALNSQGQAASMLQASAATALASLQRNVGSFGLLRVWEFCDGRATSLEACAAVTKSVDIGKVVNSLVSFATGTETSPAGFLPPPPIPSNTGRNVAGVALATGLGLLFGMLAFWVPWEGCWLGNRRYCAGRKGRCERGQDICRNVLYQRFYFSLTAYR